MILPAPLFTVSGFTPETLALVDWPALAERLAELVRERTAATRETIALPVERPQQP